MICTINVCQITRSFVYVVINITTEFENLIENKLETKIDTWELCIDSKHAISKRNIFLLFIKSNYVFHGKKLYLSTRIDRQTDLNLMTHIQDCHVIHCRLKQNGDRLLLIATRNGHDYHQHIKQSYHSELNPLNFWYDGKADVIKCICTEQILTLHRVQHAESNAETDIYPYTWKTFTHGKSYSNL